MLNESEVGADRVGRVGATSDIEGDDRSEPSELTPRDLVGRMGRQLHYMPNVLPVCRGAECRRHQGRVRHVPLRRLTGTGFGAIAMHAGELGPRHSCPEAGLWRAPRPSALEAYPQSRP
jgi:hypothetical protein